jgi:hypothetical protein
VGKGLELTAQPQLGARPVLRVPGTAGSLRRRKRVGWIDSTTGSFTREYISLGERTPSSAMTHLNPNHRGCHSALLFSGSAPSHENGTERARLAPGTPSRLAR